MYSNENLKYCDTDNKTCQNDNCYKTNDAFTISQKHHETLLLTKATY